MKSYLGRVFAMHPLALVAAVCLVAVTIPLARWEWRRGSEPSVQEVASQVVREEVTPVLKSAAATIDRVPELVVGEAGRQGDAILKALVGQIGGLREQLAGEHGQVAAIREELLGERGQVAQLRGELREMAAPVMANAVAITAKVDAGLGPVMANVDEAAKELPPALRDVRFLAARSARAMGHVEGAAQQIETAVPDALAKFQIAEAAGVTASEKTAQLMGNLATATKPLPKWVRWTFGITGQICADRGRTGERARRGGHVRSLIYTL